MQQSKERREYPRMPFNRLVFVQSESGMKKPFVCENYSAGGMAFTSVTPLNSGELLELNFWLMEPEKKEINITAEVLNNYKNGEEYTSSVKFIGQLELNYH